MPATEPHPGMPRWAKLQTMLAGLLLLLIFAMSTGLVGLGGGHEAVMAGHGPSAGGRR